MNNKIKLIPFLYLIGIAFFIGACEDVVEIDLEEGKVELVVDAWINNKPETQTIKLRRTSPYFEASFAPVVLDATVTITDGDGNTFPFVDTNNDGNYIWEPTPGNSFGTIGQTYELSIQLEGVEYTASSAMNRVPPIDSIGLEDREPELGQPAGIYAQFYSRDPIGVGDCYWIKTYKNDIYLNKPQEINIAYDAGFTAGSEVDGFIFIPPIREAINRIPDSGADAVDNADLPPWAVGDSIAVELYSITEEAFFFWERARIQLTLGDAAIFAEPPSNVPSNISSTNTEETPQGFFNVSAVSSLGKKIE